MQYITKHLVKTEGDLRAETEYIFFYIETVNNTSKIHKKRVGIFKSYI